MPTVLVVDDDADIRGVVAFKLTRAGFEVREATDGEAGLAAAITTRPELVLLDWMMPRLSGLEVCRAIRDEPALAATRVIMLTARAQASDVRRALEAGASDFIAKPFSPREVVSRARAVLGERALPAT